MFVQIVEGEAVVEQNRRLLENLTSQVKVDPADPGCCGWVITSTRFLSRWVGWLAIATGAGLALTRISWTSRIWLLPYLMFWMWVLTMALLLLQRNFRGTRQSR